VRPRRPRRLRARRASGRPDCPAAQSDWRPVLHGRPSRAGHVRGSADGPGVRQLGVTSAARTQRTGQMSYTGHGNKGVKQKLVHEVRKLVAIALYLVGFFAVFRLYTRLVLEQYGINYFEYGLTLLKSLALAKIILTGEALRLGERWIARPL